MADETKQDSTKAAKTKDAEKTFFEGFFHGLSHLVQTVMADPNASKIAAVMAEAFLAKATTGKIIAETAGKVAVVEGELRVLKVRSELRIAEEVAGNERMAAVVNSEAAVVEARIKKAKLDKDLAKITAPEAPVNNGAEKGQRHAAQ